MALGTQLKTLLESALGLPECRDELVTAIDSNTSSASTNTTNIAATTVVANSVYGGAFANSGSNAETSTTNAGALSTSKLLSNISAAGAETRTLAVPAASGQLKEITMTVHGGDCTLALTNIVGARAADGTIASTTATFSAVGQSLILLSAGGKWVYLGGNCVCT